MPVMTWEEIRKLRQNSTTQQKSNVMTWEQIRAARGIQSSQPTPQPTSTPTVTTPQPEVTTPKRYGLWGENSLFNDIKTGVKKLQARGEQKTRETFGPKTPELQLSKALREEKSAELTAKFFTAPVRFTAGSLATLATSYALEKANSNKKYTPKTDAEKLIIGETDIQRLTQQEDLYGIVARSTSIPVALTLAAIVENPFIKGTGIGTTIKESLERAIEKKVISTIGTKELIKLADEAIQAEVKIGKIKPEEALKASSDINSFRVKAVSPKLKKAEKTLTPEQEAAKNFKETWNKAYGNRPEKIQSENVLDLHNKSIQAENNYRAWLREQPEAQRIVKDIQEKYDTIPLSRTKDRADFLKNEKQKLDTKFIKEYSKLNKSLTTPLVEETKPVILDIPKDIPKDTPFDTFTARVSQRISDQAIAEGLVKDAQEFGDLPVQQVQHLKDQAVILGKVIDEDPELLKEIARGKATYPGLNPSHAFITVKNQAIKNGDLELLRELATSPSAVPQQATEAGRLIQALDEGSDDAFKNIKKVVDTRTNATKDKIAKEVSNIKKKNIIKKSAPKKDEWIAFLDEIKCPK